MTIFHAIFPSMKYRLKRSKGAIYVASGAVKYIHLVPLKKLGKDHSFLKDNTYVGYVAKYKGGRAVRIIAQVALYESFV